MKKKVKKIIDQIRPNIQMDGGDIELVDVDEKTGIVKIKFKGACVGCPMAAITLHAGIAQTLKNQIPEVTDVIPVEI
ncbi:MAG: NifU family protein [Candidatus Buchananbacteria bacterium]|nr:NifU family protein [Candidatus Buchananbacteria bacterium]